MSKKISRRNRRIRNLLLVISMMMVVAMASVGVTVAWLTDSSDTVVNTFTASDIEISLAETGAEGEGTKTNSYKMVPGNKIAKDPRVTVEAGSEKCYVFVQLEETFTRVTVDGVEKDFDDYLTYTVDSTIWEALTGHPGVYYKVVDATGTSPVTFNVLTSISGGEYANGYVEVKEGVTKAMMDALTETNTPKLTVKAYACQFVNLDSPEAAWTAAQNGGTVTP